MELYSFLVAVLALVVAICSFIFRKPGPQGPVGPMGARGIPGEDGHDGFDGKDGKDGKDGVDGKPGVIQIIAARDLTEDEIKSLLNLIPGAAIKLNGDIEFEGSVTAKNFYQSKSQ